MDLSRPGMSPLETSPTKTSNPTKITDDDLDLLPEFRSYRDKGCALAPACLECPFPVCAAEDQEPWALQRMEKSERNALVVQLYQTSEMSMEQIGRLFGLTRMSIHRILNGKKGTK